MLDQTISKIILSSKEKAKLVNENFMKYFILSMMAGIYVGFGIILIFSIGAPLKAAGSPELKALMGVSFSLALTLVIFAGSELFTGNNMVMTIGFLSKEVSWLDTIKVWIVSYFGNLGGSLLLAYGIFQTGLISQSPLKEFILGTTAMKMNVPATELFFRGILCNILVCLAVWMSTRAKEEIARLVLIFLCLFGFIGSGFEHSIANMTLLGMGLFIPHDPTAISWLGFTHNLTYVTLGNMVGGGIFVGAMYFYVGSEKKDNKKKGVN